jgi:class 3 adenylate cyclase/tetratricopeptide (TPR) repeat protein
MEGTKMQCPKCQFENPEDSNFCLECGQKLEQKCPQCEKVLPVGAKFCNGCGHQLITKSTPSQKEFSFDEKLDKIQKYLPKGLTEKILSQRDRIEGEKKQVTVLFCDLEGYTALSEKLGPEEIYSLMDQVYEILIHRVHDYEGTVNELTGDGVMALFGAPIALEEAPQRAIRSALAIHKEITKFSERMTKERGIPPIRMRIGIHSGPVVLGTVGNDLRVDFKAVGDTVNLASRMQGLAEPGTVYVTEDTFKLTEGLFRFEAIGERQVKGKEAPVRIYQVIAPSSRRTRFDVSAEIGLTPFVGRDRELELLIDGFERAKEGSGQAFSIIGEAGIGKSRFLYEFRKAVSNEDITFLEGKCLSYGKSVPYHPISDVLKGNFDIREDESDSDIRKKVQRSLDVLKADEATTLPYLLELLAVKDSGIDKIPMSPEGRRDRIIEAVKQIILKGAQIRPLVIAIEDLHWADKSTEDALKWLFEAVPGARVLTIFTYRPEFVHKWGGWSFHNQITLNRLSNREGLLMVSRLLGMEAVDSEVQKLILSKTEGVPFFIEEFVTSLHGLGVIERQDGRIRFKGDPQSIAIPSTVQDTIMARVDRLSDQAKAVLQAGSAIEREFPHDLIRTVTGLPEVELLTHLSALKDAELLYERGIYPNTSYIFRHALTQEVVYGSILARRRRELNNQIGAAIEEIHKDDLTEHYEILSEHFYQSEDYAKAAEYAKRSARKAQKSASLQDATAQARKRVLCIDKLPDSGYGDKERIDARTALGLYLTQMNYHVEARDAVEPVVRLARDKGYRKRVGQIQTIMGSYYGFVEEDFASAFEALDEALRIAGEEQDIITLVLASFWSGCLQAFNCDFEKARSSLQRALDINIAAKSLWGIALLKAQLAYLCYFFSGEINAFAELSSEALKIAEESGDPQSKGVSYTIYGNACLTKGLLEDAVSHSLKGRKLCERIGHYLWAGSACAFLAQTYFEMKEYKKSIEFYDQARWSWQQVSIIPSWIRWANLGMVKCGVMLGKKDVNLDPLRAILEKNKIKVTEGPICNYLGEILLNLGGRHASEAEHWILKALEADERNSMRFQLGLDYALYASYFQCKGDRPKARENLGKSIDILRQCGSDWWVEKYENQLTDLL